MKYTYLSRLLLVLLMSLAVGAFAQPPNDLCANAIPLAVNSSVTGNTSTATFDGAASCGTSNTAPGIWYSMVGNGENWDIVTCNSVAPTYDTKVSVFSGTCGAMTCVQGRDDGCGTRSRVPTFTSVIGTNYLILVHGFSNATGAFTLTNTSAPAPPPLVNDDCSGALPITPNGTVSGTTVGANTETGLPGSSCGTSISQAGVWYTVQGNGDLFEFSTCGAASFDTKLSVYEGTNCVLSCLTGNDDACGTRSQTAGIVSAIGQTYYVLVHGFSGTGTFDLNLIATPAPAPANDDCTAAITILEGETKIGTTLFATPETGIPTFCGTTYDNAPGVWYKFTGTGSAVTASLCGSSYDTKLNVYQAFGSCALLICTGGNDDACGARSNLSFVASAGIDYYILVHGFGSATGDYELEMIGDPNNDDCANAIPIACGDVVSGNTSQATPDGAPFCGTSNSAPGVWYKLPGNTGQLVTASLCGSAYDTKLSVYEGSCGNLICVGGNDDACGFQSEIQFASTSGTDYYILVHGFGSSVGNFDLAITCAIPPANNDCANAIAVGLGSSTAGTTVDASTENISSCGVSSTSPGVWYTWTGTGDKLLASLCNANTNFDTKLSVYEGNCNSLSCVSGNDDGGAGCGLSSKVSFCSEAGTNYFILVHGFGGQSGPFQLDFDIAPVGLFPANDECVNAANIEHDGSEIGSTRNACPFPDATFCGVSNTAPGVWYTFQGTGARIDLNTCEQGYDTKLSLYTGSCNSLVCEEGNDDDCGLRSGIQTRTVAGQTYYALVHGFGGATGDFELSLDRLADATADLTDYDAGASATYTMFLVGPPGNPEYTPTGGGLQVNLNGDNSATVTGSIRRTTGTAAMWNVNIQLRDAKDWAAWSAGGGSYKGNHPEAIANHTSWEYYIIHGSSFISGVPSGPFSGDTLWLSHNPASHLYGMQRGLGANDFNGNEGISGWFSFTGAYTGNGDLNATVGSFSDPFPFLPAANNVIPQPLSMSDLLITTGLQGPANNLGVMTPALSNSSSLPQQQPFNNAAYSYAGTEAINGSFPNTVDWVLVQLRDPIDARIIVAQRAMLLQADGQLIDMNGNIGLDISNFGLTGGTSYYISLAQNNHLDVMTAYPMDLSGSKALNFTKGMEDIYQSSSIKNAPMTKLANGKFVMISGDSDCNGVINQADADAVLGDMHSTGTSLKDTDCNGLINAADMRAVIPNKGKTTHVPQ